MKFITSRNLKFVAILLVILTLINFTFSTEQQHFTKINKCSLIKQERIKEEIRDEYTKKIIFFVFVAYFYTSFL